MSSSDQSRDRSSNSRRNVSSGYLPEDPLLTAKQAAVETGKGLSTFWRDVKAGRIPQPYYVSERSPRWRRSDLRVMVEMTLRVAPRSRGTIVERGERKP